MLIWHANKIAGSVKYKFKKLKTRDRGTYPSFVQIWTTIESTRGDLSVFEKSKSGNEGIFFLSKH